MPKTSKVPSLRLHKATGLAVCRLNGRDFYFGPYGSAEAERSYHALIAKWLAGGRQPVDDPGRPAPVRVRLLERETGSRLRKAGGSPAAPSPLTSDSPPEGLTIVELVAAFVRYQRSAYPDYANPKSVPSSYKTILALLVEHYGRESAGGFGPRKLRLLRDVYVQRGWVRSRVNAAVTKVRNVFRWACSEEMLPGGVYHALLSLPSLKYGQALKESIQRQPAPVEDVRKALEKMPRVVRDLARLQMLTGSRPGELFKLRPCDVDTTSDVWIYAPVAHKGRHLGKRRVIAFGPQCQEVLRPYLDRDPLAYCFSPKESEAERRAEQHARRRTPLSCGNRPGKGAKPKTRRKVGETYTAGSYQTAIERACQAAGVPVFVPYQLRHLKACLLRQQFGGLDEVQLTLGHAHASTSERYAKLADGRLIEVARLTG
jgi:integrase